MRAVVGAAGCEEINHVRVVAPGVLEGATVTVQGTELRAKLARVQSDSTVETDVDIPLAPLDETLVIEREGCQSINVPVAAKTGRTTVVIRPNQALCETPRLVVMVC